MGNKENSETKSCIAIIGAIAPVLVAIVACLSAILVAILTLLSPIVSELAKQWFSTPTSPRSVLAYTPTPTNIQSPTLNSTFSSALIPTTNTITPITHTPTPSPVYTPTNTNTPTPSPSPTSTSTFTPTPTPTNTPTTTPVEPIISFWADDTRIEADECTVLHWHVENVSAIFLNDEGVVGPDGSQRKCPDATKTYYLRVVRLDSQTELRQVTVEVYPRTSTQPIVTPPCELVHDSFDGPEINDLEVTITSPEHCDFDLEPYFQNPIIGTYDGNLAGRVLLVLAYDSDSARFHPKEVKMQPAGNWNTELWDATGAQIDIIVGVTEENSLVDNTIKAWLEQCKVYGCPPGLTDSELRDGLTEMDAIAVKTKR